ncbi:CPBP family intramembrane glutamic endopeptidase [Butyrivibrio sp. MC2021]|uniref:CPBP family intramembrane glutamic endopeptidase n=1 Tax=Butyrivibrio sp. MC2021 TaxID=1408306 RepID=UPI00047BDBF2|nr:type II CAAX endopeptidase family protein [Butyrivibrio sp. MC2021]
MKPEFLCLFKPSKINDRNYYTFSSFRKRYKWYYPILTASLALVFFIVFLIMIVLLSGGISLLTTGNFFAALDTPSGYEGMDFYTPEGVILSFGGIAVIYPAILLAALVTRERPLHTFISSRGGWNWHIFFVGLFAAFLANGLPQIILWAVQGGLKDLTFGYTFWGFICFLILLPFQCLAEEYMFRAFLGQTLGAWLKIPALAIILQSIVFTLLHGYDIRGQITIFNCGIIFGLIAWYTEGIEVAVAAHLINNFFSFMICGLEGSVASSEVSVAEMIFGMALDIALLVIVIFINKKTDWFKVKKPESVEPNEAAGVEYGDFVRYNQI